MTDEDPTAAVRSVFAAQGIAPTDDELGIYAVVAPMLQAMTQQLYLVEIGDEL